jgi:prohibitin 2
MSPQALAKTIGVAILLFVGIIVAATSTYTVAPGFRGIEVTLGKVSPGFKPEGFGLKTPFITQIIPVEIRQRTAPTKAACYSSDLQQVTMDLKVLYRTPEASVVKIFQEYSGSPFDSLISPRVMEAMKEVTSQMSAEMIVKRREEIKTKALALAKLKVGEILMIEDLVIENIELSPELETAIEAKMVQEQEAAKAKFTQQKAEIEAETSIIKAKGEAEGIRVRSEALKLSPQFIDLQIVEKWDGRTPLVISGGQGGGANILLPLDEIQRSMQELPPPPTTVPGRPVRQPLR